MHQHCFLLDGKTILPIDHYRQLFIPLKIINHIENKSCLCCERKYRSFVFDHHCQYSNDEKLKAINKYSQVDEEDFHSYSFQSINNLSKDKYFSNKIPLRKIVIAKRSQFKHHRFNTQLNNNTETYLITRVKSSINYPIDSIQINNNQSHKSSSAITTIIKPFLLSENQPSLEQKLVLDKRKNSSSSLKTTTKRISTSLSDQMLNKISHKHQLSTFKDIIRPILPNKTVLNHNENISSTILNSRKLFDIYRHKKQHLIEK